MEIKTINLQLTKNIGNYESIKLGGEWSLDANEDINAAMVEADEQLKAAFFALRNKPTEQPTATAQPIAPDGTPKKVLEFGTPTLQAICDKIAKENTDISVVEQWFTFDDKVRNVLILAKTIA